MLINRVVLNVSPLICLFKSNLTELLPAMFKDIVVPSAVIQEITAEGKADFAAQALLSQKWLNQIGDIPIDPRVVAWDLGRGESAVLSFALKNPEYWAVMDDREARRCAMALGCRVVGTLGLIVVAKKRGIITSIREALEKLEKAGFWLSVGLVDEICRKAGEK